MDSSYNNGSDDVTNKNSVNEVTKHAIKNVSNHIEEDSNTRTPINVTSDVSISKEINNEPTELSLVESTGSYSANGDDKTEEIIGDNYDLEGIDGTSEDNSLKDSCEKTLKPDLTTAAESTEEVAKPVRYFTKRTLKYQTPMSSMEPLPEGWVMVPHSSGIPVYLHKKSKVVTWSRPYIVTVDMGGIKRHDIPIASIPCLDYIRTRKKIELDLELASTSQGDSVNEEVLIKTEDMENGVEVLKDDSAGLITKEDRSSCHHLEKADLSLKTSTSAEDKAPEIIDLPKAILHSTKDQYLEEKELMEYLNKRFLFDSVSVPHFERWADKRQYTKKQRREANRLNEDAEDSRTPRKLGPAKVITLTIPRESGSDRPQKVVFNTSIKPMVCVLHEYAQSVLRTKPYYEFAIKDDSSEPFEATIVINDKKYGSACGINKKSAKNKAALATMEMLVPGFKDQVECLAGESSVEYFNDVSVTDPRVYELCVHAGNFLPYQLLTECLKRNQGIADTSAQFDVQIGKAKMIEYKMECGKHTVTGTAKNKKIGKQLAAQQILQLLHPNVKSWGELIRAYGTSVAEKRARKKNIEQEIFELKQRKPTLSDASGLDDSAVTSQDESMTSSSHKSDKNKDSLIANPELLAKLREMMLQLGTTRGTVNGEKRKANEEETEECRKRRKLLLIDV